MPADQEFQAPSEREPLPIWHIDRETGALLAPGLARPDPLDPDNWLVPASATSTAPPALAAGEEAAFVAGAWVKRKKPAPVVEQPAATPAPDPKVARKSEIRMRLDVIDRSSVRPLREALKALAEGKQPPAFVSNKIATLEGEAEQLRTELAAIK